MSDDKRIPLPDNQRKRPGYDPDAKPQELPPTPTPKTGGGTVEQWAEKTLEDILKKSGKK